MTIFFIGIIVLGTIFNCAFYEYRVQKQTQDFDMFQKWINFKLTKKYKC